MTRPSRRRLSIALIALATVGGMLASPLARAQHAFPSRPLKIVVPYPPGGTTDLLARILAPRLGQAVVIDNKPGAGGVIGAQQVAKSPADGYTLVFATIASHAIIPALQSPPPYDPVKDFAPITLVAGTPNVRVPPASLHEISCRSC